VLTTYTDAQLVGGQGIVSGFRDAIALSWRLKLATQPSCLSYKHLFRGWYVERKQQLERSLAATIESGKFCNEPSYVKAYFRDWYLWAVQLVPSWRHNLQLGARREGLPKYDWQEGLPFLPDSGGRKSFPQVFSAKIDEPAAPIPEFTDDTIFRKDKKGIFQIVAILDSELEIRSTIASLENLDVSASNAIIIEPKEATIIFHSKGESMPYDKSLIPSGHTIIDVVRVVDASEYTAAGQTPEALATGWKRPEPLQ